MSKEYVIESQQRALLAVWNANACFSSNCLPMEFDKNSVEILKTFARNNQLVWEFPPIKKVSETNFEKVLRLKKEIEETLKLLGVKERKDFENLLIVEMFSTI
jgi:hypothetical protein